jgi:endonuclease G
MNKKSLVLIAAAVLAVVLIVASIATKGKSGSQTEVAHVGGTAVVPDGALEIPTYTRPRAHSQQIEHKAYTVDYNEEWRLANWVAYPLTAEHTKGPVERYNKFDADPQVKGATAQWWDYKHTTYDRGHLVPAGDMKWDETAMRECFYLSNIAPQDHTFNEGDWNYLENRVRGWANFFGEVYVVCGPIVSEHPEVIGENCIAVPDSFFKVVLCDMRGEWNAVGFICPNDPTHHNLSHYTCTVDEVERITGLDFFPLLPDDVEERIEAGIDWEAWRIR